MIKIRYEDFWPEEGSTIPPQNISPKLLNEAIVSVETIKDTFGYQGMRVWIIGDR